MRLVGHSDQGGRPDAVQVMVHRGHAYVGHMFSKGFSVIDVRDPKRPRPVEYVAAPPGTWNIHLQTHDDLLLVIHAKDMFADAAFADEHAYYSGSIGRTVGTAAGAVRPPRATGRPGVAVFDVARPAAPRPIGFMPVEGGGIHRLWYAGGRWAYASALLDGFSDYIFLTIDMADPTRPREAGRFWLPGMHLAAGEQPALAGQPAVRPPPRHRARRHRLRRLARRRPGDAGRRRPRRAPADRPPELVAALRGRHPQLPAAARTATCWSSPTRPCWTTRRTGSSSSGSSTSGSRPTRSASPRCRRPPRPTTRPGAGTSGRTTSTRTARGASSATG